MNYSPAKTLILFFLGLIAVGTLLLSLPVSRNLGFDYSFLTALFTATSAVCVTGLTVVPIGDYYTSFGQSILILLVQLGGLGYMFISTVVTLLVGKMALKDRRIMQELFDISSFKNLKHLLYKAVFFVLSIEFIGAVILTINFMTEFPFLKSCYLGIFHSITAFCNAGFTPFSQGLIGYSNSPMLLYPVMALIVLGGLGFFVLVDLYDTHNKKSLHFTTHTKVSISLTAWIILIGFVYFLLSKETGLITGNSVPYSINNSLFQAVSARTAGFATIPVNNFSEITKVVLIFLMSIGGTPGSTAGGLKVTTLALVFVFVMGMLKSDEDFVLFKRRMSKDTIHKALTIFVVYYLMIMVLSAVLILLEGDKQTIDLIFETVSAFATVGLSTGITNNLSIGGQITIIIAMLVGRIGIITMLISMITANTKKKNVRYPEAGVMVG